jgi:hypothetical protein
MDSQQEPTTRELLIRIDNLTTKVGEMHSDFKELKSTVIDLKLSAAHKSGYEQGAAFWFKAGWGAALSAVVGGFLIMYSIVTGKVNPTDFFK